MSVVNPPICSPLRMHNICAALLAFLIASPALPTSAAGPLREALKERSTTGKNTSEAAPGQRQFLTHDGMTRSYVVRAPNELLQGNRRVPLVLVLHGGGGNAGNAEAMTGFTEKARQEGFIVVYPEGSGRMKDKLLTWNAGHCCGYAMENRVNDAGFINALIDRLIADFPVDPRRIYATGMSNGGMMSHRLGIELSHRITAIAPVVATLFGDERKPPHPVSAIMINGMLDASVPHRGGPPGGRFADAWDGAPAKPAVVQAQFWADAGNCGEPVKNESDAVIVQRYRCPAGRAVELYLVKDNGHAWPGGQTGSRMGDKPSTTINATDVIWDFFKTQTR
ncbi:MAG: PHB depolymerase family esterase [Burkholderiales bacterium]|nr:PHB depolymerase family esterase [Burkholderiales bacterium]